MLSTQSPAGERKQQMDSSNFAYAALDKQAPPLALLRVQAGPSSSISSADTSSESEPEGSSPTLCGRARVTAPRPRRVGRVLRALLRKQSGGAEQDEQQCWGEVCGSSYDSLISLDETCAAEAVPPTTQQQQQLEQPYHHEAPPTTTPAQQQQQPQQQPQQDGMLRRCVKAVLRPVVKAVCGAARALAANAGPQGPGTNDHTRAERIINVLTSLPFFAVGLHGLRNRRCPKGRHFALSFIALGAVATGYHGAERSSWLRPVMRKMDYYTICYTSTVLRRAAHIPLPGSVKAAALLIAPFKPSVVTGLNLALVEGKFLKSALAHTHLRSTFKAHIGSAAVGMVCFAYEDVATGAGWPPVLHSLWHCLSAAAMGALHGLLQHLELAVLMEGMQLEAAR